MIRRSEIEIFNDLEILCKSPGYLHTIVKLYFDSNYGRDAPSHYHNIINSELTMLTGFVIKGSLDISHISEEVLTQYEIKTKDFLQELHDSMSYVIGLNQSNLREPIFYATPSGLNFQYMEFSKERYKEDKNWLRKSQGFIIEQAIDVINFISQVLSDRMEASKGSFALNIFIFTVQELITLGILFETSISKETIEKVLVAFSREPGCNEDYKQVGDYNYMESHPIIRLGKEKYLFFMFTNFCKSLYRSPIYWMRCDEKYKDRANVNRGKFTEAFVANQLIAIFGKKNVHKNVEIRDSKHTNTIKAEIDILVTYANIAIVVQIKSKGLTFNSRKGDRVSLKNDFDDSIQAAYNQAWKSAEHLIDSDCEFTENHTQLKIPKNLSEIIILCVVADDYPSLPIHVDSFLELKKPHNIISNPYITDIFILHSIVTFLNTPLYFLHYIRKRTKYFRQICSISGSESDVLSRYLKDELVIQKNWQSRTRISEDCASVAVLDAIMINVHNNSRFLVNEKIKGILTKFTAQPFKHIIDCINSTEDVSLMLFGFFLLELNEQELKLLTDECERARTKSIKNKISYHCSKKINDAGISIYYNYYNNAEDGLLLYCELAKYNCKAKEWFGIELMENNRWKLEHLDWVWEQSEANDNLIRKYYYDVELATDIKYQKNDYNSCK